MPWPKGARSSGPAPPRPSISSVLGYASGRFSPALGRRTQELQLWSATTIQGSRNSSVVGLDPVRWCRDVEGWTRGRCRPTPAILRASTLCTRPLTEGEIMGQWSLYALFQAGAHSTHGWVDKLNRPLSLDHYWDRNIGFLTKSVFFHPFLA